MPDAHRPDPVADRSLRLVLFGGVAVVAGLGLALLALAYVALPFTGALRTTAVHWPSIIAGSLTYLLLGAIFVWTGVGSILRRRWVRSVMLVLAWSWLLSGAMLFVFCAFLLEGLLMAGAAQGPAQGPVTPEVAAAARLVVLAGLGACGVVLPALFIVVYRDPALLATCERVNPEPGWTDRCPVTVLGLSLGLAAAALFSMPMLANPVVPLFGAVVVGWPGALITLAAAAACAALAWSTFRLEPRGWWGSTLLLTLIGVSTAVTFAVADPEALFAAMTRSDGSELGLADSGPSLMWASLVFTAVSVVYMLGIRRHFRPGTR